MKNKSLFFVIVVALACRTAPAQWARTSGLDHLTIHTLAATASNLFAGSDNGVFRTDDRGASWTPVNTGLTDTIVFSLAVRGAYLFAGTGNYGGLFRSSTNGADWNSVGLDWYDVTCVAVSSTNLFAGTGVGLFVSTDNGNSWRDTLNLGTGWVLSLAVSGNSLFAGNYGGVYYCTYDGTSWSEIQTGLAYGVSALAVSGTKVFASGIGVLRSTDNGTTWTRADSTLTNRDVLCFLVAGSNLFAGTNGNGVFLSTNDGATWKPVNEGLLAADVLSLVVSGDELYAGLLEGGVWHRPLAEMVTSIKPVGNPLPSRIALEQNHPNPFNPSTTIVYALPNRSLVSMTVYNALGQRVAVLVDGEVEAGRHEVTFNASGLSSGVYLCRLVTPHFAVTKRLVLVR